MLKTVSLLEASEKLAELLEQVKRERAPLTIIEGDVPSAVLLPIEHYKALIAQLGDYRDYLDVLQAQQEPAESLETVLADLGLADV